MSNVYVVENVHIYFIFFTLEVCGRGFKQKATLAQHERTHTDERPFDCPDCHKRFRQQSHLVQHLRIHSDERPYGCTYCEKVFFRHELNLTMSNRMESFVKKSFFSVAVARRSVRRRYSTSISGFIQERSRTFVHSVLNASGKKPYLISTSGRIRANVRILARTPNAKRNSSIRHRWRNISKSISRTTSSNCWPRHAEDR